MRKILLFQLFPEGWVERISHWAQPANEHLHRGKGQKSKAQSYEPTTNSSAHHTDAHWMSVCRKWLFCAR